MAGKSPDAIRKTMDDINLAVAENLGYDLAHVWVFEESAARAFLMNGRTWAELQPVLYPEKRGPNDRGDIRSGKPMRTAWPSK